MDVRFTGDTLQYLEAVSAFAKQEPRKQSIERASFQYLPEVHGTYQEFLSAINASVKGRGIWGPNPVPEVKPVGPVPLYPDPLDDDFSWGVGTEADFIAFVPCRSLPLTRTWLFNDWIFRFATGSQTPRLFCPQAVSRSSRQLLDVVHTAQKEQGLSIASEATMASFAMWHGLKISYPPQPWFIDPPGDAHALDDMLNGGPPKTNYSGFSFGAISYDEAALHRFQRYANPSWYWRSDLPKTMMNYWLDPKSPISDDIKLPDTLRRHNGQIYVINMALHPVKTNPDLSWTRSH